VAAIRAAAPRAHIFLTEGAIVSDDVDRARPQKATLRRIIKDVVTASGDAGIHAVESTQYPGDACNRHPTREQHAAMARDLEPVLRRALGW